MDPATGLQNGVPVQLDTGTSSSLLGQSTSLPDQIFAAPSQENGTSATKVDDLLVPKSEPMDEPMPSATHAQDGGESHVDFFYSLNCLPNNNTSNSPELMYFNI